MENSIMMKVIVYQEGPVWIAQGIEVDIVARATTLDAVQEAFKRAVARTMAVSKHLSGQPFSGIGKAPDKFKRMFEDAQSRLVPVAPTDIDANETTVDLRLATAS
jgi:hypothetical protein